MKAGRITHRIDQRTRVALKPKLEAGEKIEKASFKLDRSDGLTIEEPSNSEKAAICYLVGGPPGCEYVLTVKIKTSERRLPAIEYWVGTEQAPQNAPPEPPAVALDVKAE